MTVNWEFIPEDETFGYVGTEKAIEGILKDKEGKEYRVIFGKNKYRDDYYVEVYLLSLGQYDELIAQDTKFNKEDYKKEIEWLLDNFSFNKSDMPLDTDYELLFQ